MLGTMQPEQKANWKKHIAALTHAYNSTCHESTVFSPHYLMFGRHPRLPVDLILGTEISQSAGSHSKYVEDVRKSLQHAYEVAKKNACENRDRHKVLYDQKIKGSVVQVDDCVLIRNVAFSGPHKFGHREL